MEVTPTILQSVNNKGKPYPRKDYPINVRRGRNCFNEFVKPHEGAIWDNTATRIHGLTANDPRILEADDMGTVWNRFLQWFDHHLERDEVAVLVAYNGETCDLKWLRKLTQAPRFPSCLPPAMN